MTLPESAMITIGMDKKFPECGKGGVADNVICMGCSVKAFKPKPMKSPKAEPSKTDFGA
jgi:hypothetical protein